jgi:SAM-dependent methyltransferase
MNDARDMGGSSMPAWQESDSALFIEMGRVMIPLRDEIEHVIVALILGEVGEPFWFADLAAGSGWLSRAILARYPMARALVLDGTETMLAESGRALAAFPGRFEPRRVRLEDERWTEDLPHPLRAVVSSLAIHHLDDAGKRALFARLFARLAPGGALLIADLVQPASERARQLAAAQWYEEVRRQSLELTGNLDIYDFFVREHWNIFAYPDPMDIPSRLIDQLSWLSEIGYAGVDVFWARAGHAVYGGCRP